MDVLLKKAKIVHAADKKLHLKKRDILIQKGTIKAIAPTLEGPEKGTKVISHKHLHVSVGWMDSGVAFGEPGHEERETIAHGLRCAAKSGFTDVLLNPTGHPLPDAAAHIAFLKNAAKGHLTNMYPLANVSVGGKGQELAELYDMQQTGAHGFYDYKTAIANPNLLKIALQYTKDFGKVLFSFPLDGHIAGKGIVNEGPTSTKLGLKGIPALAEELQVARDLFILEYTGGSLHIPTISTAKSVALIANAKRKGLQVSCSVAVHHLAMTDAVLNDFDPRYKVMPPLREKEDQKALIKGLKNGTIDFVTTDHRPMNIELKQVEFDNAAYGTIGLESAFGALSGIFDLEETIALLTKGRSTFALPEPTLSVGSPACLTLFDPTAHYTFTERHVHSTSKNSLFLGHFMKGSVLGSMNNDQLILN
ncbi:dihydroorotase [Maribacter sp. 2307ULW6-5]|uniref:dihydroorotase n=1 Tax=Maribacter sp. 2307ULW6-5 TaxID=3386275 RepID=UPI0039BC8A1B